MKRLNGVGYSQPSPVPEVGGFLFGYAAQADFFEEWKPALPHAPKDVTRIAKAGNPAAVGTVNASLPVNAAMKRYGAL